MLGTAEMQHQQGHHRGHGLDRTRWDAVCLSSLLKGIHSEKRSSDPLGGLPLPWRRSMMAQGVRPWVP